MCFLLMIVDRAYALTLLCIHNRSRLHSLYAERVGRPRVVNCMCMSHDMSQVMRLTIMMIYPCYFIHLHLSFCVALNSVQYCKMAPYVFLKTFLVNAVCVRNSIGRINQACGLQVMIFFKYACTQRNSSVHTNLGR
jgi:hypothetical protein